VGVAGLEAIHANGPARGALHEGGDAAGPSQLPLAS
jgi:hypothetical protein